MRLCSHLASAHCGSSLQSDACALLHAKAFAQPQTPCPAIACRLGKALAALASGGANARLLQYEAEVSKDGQNRLPASAVRLASPLPSNCCCSATHLQPSRCPAAPTRLAPAPQTYGAAGVPPNLDLQELVLAPQGADGAPV